MEKANIKTGLELLVFTQNSDLDPLPKTQT